MSAPWYLSKLDIENLSYAQPNLVRYKHLIIGIYVMGRNFARQEHYNYEAAVLLSNRVILGVIINQVKTPGLADTESATTNTSSPTNTWQVSYNTSVADEPGIFTDPADANFVIYYDKLGGKRVYIDDLFTAFIDALANASPNDVDTLGASVNSLAYNGQARLVILDAGATGHPLLTWGRCIQAIGQLWRGFTALHDALETTRFDIEYAGVKLGSGFFKAVTPAIGDGTAIARRDYGSMHLQSGRKFQRMTERGSVQIR